MKKEVLKEIATKGTEEFYTPIPKGYKAGRTKYIIVTGSVISGIGKGIFTSSLGRLLKDRGMKIEPIKLEAYMNVDAGTLNPYRHGEVFVLDDGTECDMDLGSYERFLDQDLSKDNFITSGKIYQGIIQKERKGGYLGRDVQFIPHVTGETKLVLRNLAHKKKPSVVLVEIGGTVGDYENIFALEAVREMIYEEGRENVCIVNLTYILEPSSTGEFKSKAAQLGIKRLQAMGIQPDVIICRSEHPIPEKIKEKISVNVGVETKYVIGAENVENIYEVPLFLRKRGVDDAILEKIHLDKKFKTNGNQRLVSWTRANAVKSKKSITVGIAGKYTRLGDSYISILKALEHCSGVLNTNIKVKWIETTSLGKKKIGEHLKGINGIIIPGGFGRRGTEGKIACIKYARERGIPFLGLCYGFQLAVIEFARNVCRLKGANSTEIDEKTKHPVICILPEQDEIDDLGGTMRLGGYNVVIKNNTVAQKLYRKKIGRERFRHRFNVNTKYIDVLEKKGLVFSGRAPQKRIMQILELSNHPFFLGTQFHPEFTSRPLKPNPIFLGFAKACAEKKRK